MTKPSTWQPILVGEEASRAEAAIDAIAGALAEWPAFPENDPFDASVASGEAGLGLFFAYLDRARPGAGYADLAGERVERAIDRLASSFHQPGLYQGYLSIAWAVEHLRDRDDPDDPNEEIDPALFELLAKTPWPEGYDLTNGLAGLGAYALERWPGPNAAACLARVCERLEELAVPQENGLAWPAAEQSLFPRERQRFPHGMVNLGVAHGVPGVLPVLAQAVAVGAAPERTRALLSGAVSWLLSRKLPEGGDSVFPDAWGPGAEPHPTRAGWCYGDPGIAATLWVTARAALEPAWEAEALRLARTAARRPPESCLVRDACLCHGAAGLSHMFNRLYQATGDPELLAAARFWMAGALDFREPGRGVAGFVTWGPDATSQMDWRDDPSLLTGAAGVGLALLAAITPIEPAWDRFLLLSPAVPNEREKIAR
ncbi:MAG TPA: lanthionine synthetase C family protein [Thermoanaerobaculia bacterium]|nr:lanthionine synthetase C family protein [Thermoanaerobaculia bacterium]